MTSSTVMACRVLYTPWLSVILMSLDRARSIEHDEDSGWAARRPVTRSSSGCGGWVRGHWHAAFQCKTSRKGLSAAADLSRTLW